MKNTPTAQLKDKFKSIRTKLPKGWSTLYIKKYCSSQKGIQVVKTYKRLENIHKGNAAPSLRELDKIETLISQ